LVEKLLKQSRLPHLAGVLGDRQPTTVAAPAALDPAAAWASAFTGLRVGQHRVFCHREATPDLTTTRPVGRSRCAGKFIWEAAAHAGRQVAAINLPSTRPDGEVPENLVVVDDPFVGAAAGCVHNHAQLAADAELLHLTAADLGERDVAPFAAGGLPLPVLGRVAEALAAATSVQNAATYVVEPELGEPAEALFVRYTLVDEVFRATVEPMPNDSRPALAAHQAALTATSAALELLDAMLGRLLHLEHVRNRYSAMGGFVRCLWA
jgi:hypothetical protein